MRGRLISAVVAGLILGVVGTFALLNQPTAYAQEKKPHWEYKIIYASTEGKDAAKAMTDQYNNLAADGWEYVGPVVDNTYSRSNNLSYTGINGVYVAFKRPK